ncbi:aromatic amino acid hydroxylase [Gangjinia marincola]|uniref:Aromatic amino acid hydroxylase n=1 Tax=Gangjinia marincola TaxID=578463 RepID=A0ABN1MG66_9FLAO
MQNTPEFESNPLIDRLPPHLKQFIKPQRYEDYSPINQAVWRYVMKKNVSYLAKVAHESYLEGLEKTGIDLEKIPSMYGMNRILEEIGWAAVAVDGFIPPNAFMEFQAYKVLVIASDIRQLENIAYTPSPDIIHEAAGHAPIIANPDYAEYLRRMGEIGARAILSAHDIALYEAVRKLSILKEAEASNPAEIASAEAEVNTLQAQEVKPSEMALIRNLQWWTVEYGLIGTPEDPRIYGAGLLSSIGESQWCMSSNVKKLPYSIDAAYQNFDITKPQPQLYVTPDFAYLMQVLEEVANTLSLRKGGHRGLQKLIDSQRVGTIELSTGLQISGVFDRMIKDEDLQVIYFQTTGPTALAYREKELIGNGTTHHSNGFGSPLGKLKSISLAIEDMGPVDLKAYNFYDGKWMSLEFESGVKVQGINVTGIRNVQGKLMLIELEDCTVSHGEEVLFSAEDGTYHMAVGKEIVSAFAGAADFNSFPNLYEASSTTTIKSQKPEALKQLEKLYAQAETLRERKTVITEEILFIFNEVKNDHQGDWLLPLNLLELSNDPEASAQIKSYIERLAADHPEKKSLIKDGVAMVLRK